MYKRKCIELLGPHSEGGNVRCNQTSQIMMINSTLLAARGQKEKLEITQLACRKGVFIVYNIYQKESQTELENYVFEAELLQFVRIFKSL